MDAITRAWAKAEQLDPAIFYDFVLFVTLLLTAKLGVARLFADPFEAVPSDRAITDFTPISIAAMVPQTLLLTPWFHRTVAISVVVLPILWAIGFQRRWIAPATVLSLTMLLCLLYTFNSVLHHQYHPMVQVLMVYALHAMLYGRGQGGDQPIWRRAFHPSAYPKWVYWTCFLVICMVYSHSGISKLRTSGLAWADGTALQAWIWSRYHGGEVSIHSGIANFVLDHGWAARALAIGTLLIESFCSISLFVPFLRPAFGVGLLFMHGGIFDVFGILFPYNMFLVVVYFFGLKRTMERFVSSRAAEVAPPMIRRSVNCGHQTDS